MYSQLGQDLWVLERYPISDGYFIDIGFNDGIKINNTYLLELNGWKGIGIDPLAKNFENRPNTTIYKVPVFLEPDQEIDFVISDFEDKEFSGIKNSLNKHKDKIYKNKYEIVKLKTQTIQNILQIEDAPKFIHYLSIDTEGSELNILQTINFENYQFGCITIEHNYVEPQRTEIKNLLYSKGYTLAKSVKWDDWYILDSETN